MRLMTMKELNRVFSLRESRRVKARVRKKNHKRVMKYLNKYGLTTVDYSKQAFLQHWRWYYILWKNTKKEMQNLKRDRIDWYSL